MGNDAFKIFGLPDAVVKESKERIHAALRSFGYIHNSTTLFA
ncbi:magnesium chelatase domain-containing protein [Neobacillus sp. LXY-1]